MIKLKDITQYIGNVKKYQKVKKKLPSTQTVIEELLDTSLTPLTSKYLRENVHYYRAKLKIRLFKTHHSALKMYLFSLRIAKKPQYKPRIVFTLV